MYVSVTCIIFSPDNKISTSRTIYTIYILSTFKHDWIISGWEFCYTSFIAQSWWLWIIITTFEIFESLHHYHTTPESILSEQWLVFSRETIVAVFVWPLIARFLCWVKSLIYKEPIFTSFKCSRKFLKYPIYHQGWAHTKNQQHLVFA